jgi:hypothetical protein
VVARRAVAFAKFLYAQRVQGLSVPEAPCFDDQGAQEFERLLRAASSYLEFGSGGSTVLASRLGVKTLSVESDRYFARQVRAKAAPGPVTVLAPDIGVTKEWGQPVFKRPTAARLRRWRGYVFSPFEALDRAGERFPDLVLIDGRFRVACALESARRAQELALPLTIFFDDYAERPHYQVIERFLGKPKLVGRAAIFEIQRDSPPLDAQVVLDFVGDVR